MSEPILPCPFCGGPASIEEFSSALAGDAVVFSVGCDSYSEDSCYGYRSLTAFNTRGGAIKGWNRRPTAQAVSDTTPVEPVECGCKVNGISAALHESLIGSFKVACMHGKVFTGVTSKENKDG